MASHLKSRSRRNEKETEYCSLRTKRDRDIDRERERNLETLIPDLCVHIYIYIYVCVCVCMFVWWVCLLQHRQTRIVYSVLSSFFPSEDFLIYSESIFIVSYSLKRKSLWINFILILENEWILWRWGCSCCCCCCYCCWAYSWCSFHWII